jgi:hypothetical protein
MDFRSRGTRGGELPVQGGNVSRRWSDRGSAEKEAAAGRMLAAEMQKSSVQPGHPYLNVSCACAPNHSPDQS